ncbi:antibiotic biosynthesis monooxygenase family protein [Streptomyces sp. ODS28]|uniref:antibiotic biosynthesis monooxygenase family protein n=1 Tax=Streptomyces sp. ODS28 TaxID=3136688 RepID=UPI0031EFBFEB
MPNTTTIDGDHPLVTLINVFTVAPARQAELIAELRDFTETVVRHHPGFVSANFHASHDGERVVNYAQWESEEQFHAMLADPEARKGLERTAAIAENVDPRLFTVESVHVV